MNVPKQDHTEKNSDAAVELERFYETLRGDNLGALWLSLKGLVPSTPRPRATAHAWSFANARTKLIEAGGLISAEEAERRVLVLENPGLPGGSQITDTIYAGLQLILPGEVAPAHRHTQSALRFVMEGTGAFTTVDGERTDMNPGDFIITPAWTWHDHGSDSSSPVIWMDGLDVPLVRFLCAGFREEYSDRAQIVAKPIGYSDARYGSGLLPLEAKRTHTSPIFNYPYERTRAALYKLSTGGDPDPHHGYAIRYVNPTNGDWAIPTIATSMRLLPKGISTLPYCSTDGAVLVVVEGRLTAKVGNKTFDLNSKDIVAIPGWTPYSLIASEDAVVFMYSDRPVHEKLGLWQEQKFADNHESICGNQ